LIQILQVILAPIPGNVTAVLGGALFGVGYGFLITTAGILIGSCLSFGLARAFGKPLVLKLIGKETYRRYNGFFHGRSLAIILIIFLLPFFPKDAFCFLIGLSSIRLTTFAIVMMIGRTPGIIVATLTGAGLIDLPTEVWIIIAVPAIAVVILSLMYGEKIERWLYNHFNRHQNAETPDNERGSGEPLSPNED